MKRWFALILVAFLSNACSIPAAVTGRSTAKLTTPGIVALHATGVGRSIDVIRDVAVSAEQTKVISTDVMLKIIKAHKGIALTLDQTPRGWQASVEAALKQLKGDLTPSERAVVGPYIDAAILIIKAVA